jgi:hypothetical protein
MSGSSGMSLAHTTWQRCSRSRSALLAWLARFEDRAGKTDCEIDGFCARLALVIDEAHNAGSRT